MVQGKKFGFTVNELLLTIIIMVSIVIIFAGNIKYEDELQEEIKSLKAEGSAASLMKAKILASSSDYAKVQESKDDIIEMAKSSVKSETKMARRFAISKISQAFKLYYSLDGKDFIPISENLFNIFKKNVPNLILQKNGSYMDSTKTCYKFYGDMTCTAKDNCYVWVDVNCAKGPDIDGIDIMKIPFVLDENGFQFDSKVEQYKEHIANEPSEFNEFAQKESQKMLKDGLSMLMDMSDDTKQQKFKTSRLKGVSVLNQAFTMQYALEGAIIPTVENLNNLIKKRSNIINDSNGYLTYVDGSCVKFDADGICSKYSQCSVMVDVNCGEKPNKDGEDIMNIPFYVKDGLVELDKTVSDSYTKIITKIDEEYMYK